MSKLNSADRYRPAINCATCGNHVSTIDAIHVQVEQHTVAGPFYRLVYRSLEDGIDTLQHDRHYQFECLFAHDFWTALTPNQRHQAWAIVLDLIARHAVPLRLTLSQFYEAPYFSLQ